MSEFPITTANYGTMSGTKYERRRAALTAAGMTTKDLSSMPSHDTPNSVIESTPPFDESRYYLGSVCKRDHNWHGTGKSLRHAGNRTCYDCAILKDRERTVRGRGQRAYAQRIEMINKIKLESGCADCGYDTHPAALHFDHLPGTVKVRGVARMYTTASIDSLESEIAKCEVVCANCHAIRTASRRQDTHSPELRQVFGEVRK